MTAIEFQTYAAIVTSVPNRKALLNTSFGVVGMRITTVPYQLC